jgi:hypothetical protein
MHRKKGEVQTCIGEICLKWSEAIRVQLPLPHLFELLPTACLFKKE